MLIEDVKVLEIILFVENKPLSFRDLVRMSRMNETRVLAALAALKEEYDKDYHGICLERTVEEIPLTASASSADMASDGEQTASQEPVDSGATAEASAETEAESTAPSADAPAVSNRVEESFALVPKRSMHERLKRTYGRKVDSRLTRAAVETLCLVAYTYGITRREIDNIRGVSSENVIKYLKDRKFIKVVGRKKDLPGNPKMYGTTEKFLYEFNLSSIADLPQLTDVDSVKYEEKDDEGHVLSGRIIKKRMKDEFVASVNAKKASRDKAVKDFESGKTEDVVIFQDDSQPAGNKPSAPESVNLIFKDPPAAKDPIAEGSALENPVSENPIVEDPTPETVIFEDSDSDNPVSAGQAPDPVVLDDLAVESPVVEKPIHRNQDHDGRTRGDSVFEDSLFDCFQDDLGSTSAGNGGKTPRAGNRTSGKGANNHKNGNKDENDDGTLF